MAVYKILPSQDTTIYNNKINSSTGIDEILEINSYSNSVDDTSRILIQFSSNDINKMINQINDYSSLKFYLKLFVASADLLTPNTSIECYPIYQSWISGTGRKNDNININNGASWTQASIGDFWETSSLPAGVESYFSNNVGGGNWIIESNNINLKSSFSFPVEENKLDIKLDITPAIHGMVLKTNSPLYSELDIDNNGFIIKFPNNSEFNSNIKSSLKYFSSNTHTIYSPVLEAVWDDYENNTTKLNVIQNSNITINISNNRETYKENNILLFRLNVRYNNPLRRFSTRSIYKENLILTSESVWGIQDLLTKEMVIDFYPENKISSDDESSYFKLFLQGMQPERYYKVLIKIPINGEVFTIDTNSIFKIIR